MMRTQLGAIGVALALLLSGCPDGGTTDASDDVSVEGDASVATDAAVVPPDATEDDVAANADTGDAGDTGDTGDTGDAGGPLPGAFGWPCTTNADCDSDYCVEGYDGKVCSVGCQGGCELGWSCRQDLAKFPDVVFVCVPTFPTLCRPCDGSAACAVEGSANARCVPRGPGGDEGAFCGGGCAGAACPAGYLCASVADVEGALTQQCVPIDGTCACSSVAIALGSSTSCAARNDAGRCLGQRRCTVDGLTACDAPTPAVDLCDGVDDDCDGETDEDHAPEACEVAGDHGVCAGVTVCDGAAGPRCDARTPGVEVCGDGIDNDCDGVVDGEGGVGCESYWLDEDGDGAGVGAPRCLCGPEGDWTARVGGDCDDTRPSVRPDAVEVCDGLDNDCSGGTDEPGAVGCSVFYRDADGDGFGDAGAPLCLCGADEEGGYTSKTPTDCDDEDGAVHPGAPEVCDGVDNDCDGVTDEPGAGNCTLHFADADGDTWGDPARFACLCGPSDDYPATRGGDCDDAAAERNPGAAEMCDGEDNDCDGVTDEPDAEGCVVYYRDGDDDGYGIGGDALCLCAPSRPYDAVEAGDCDDAAAAVNPGAAEVCSGRDDDCDGEIDEADAEGCAIYHRDDDLDSYGVAGDTRCLCAPSLPYLAGNGDDCDDSSPFIHPGALEVCNGKDDDCDGETDEGVEATCSPFYYDADGDGWGIADDSECLCGPQGLYRAVNAGDCDDEVDTTHPFAQERCDGVDNDCDGATDEQGAAGCEPYYIDGDGDGVGIVAGSRCLCGPEGLHTATVGGDCDDADEGVFPGAAEVCNGVDDDCDGAVDPPGSGGCSVYLRDSDQDGYGVTGDSRCLCAPGAPYTATVGGDCNDADATVNPGATETCNGKDDDCSGVADDPGTVGCVQFYRDGDGDTWGDPDDALCLCGPVGAYRATTPGDCDDALAAVNPAAIEVCNELDDDCDAATDEEGAVGCTLYLRDEDGDGFGVDGDLRCLCGPDEVYRATVGGDCDDAAAEINPGAPEVCNGVDDDCNGQTDEEGAVGCDFWLRDLDGDGFGVDTDARCLCEASGVYRAEIGGDCNDSTALISPEATEHCNATDDDCDGDVDEEDAVGCLEFYVDGDGDGWGVGAPRCLCAADGDHTATLAVDCDDDDPDRNPGLPERCGGDGKDEDCDGVTDEANAIGCVDYYEDGDGDGFGLTLSRTCLCAPVGDFSATVGGDCDDGDGEVFPGQVEVCNAVDDDCDGLFDEGCGTQVGGWPSAKGDLRRSGHSTTIAGPATNALRWKRRLSTSVSLRTSAVVDLDGAVIVAVQGTLYKLDPSDGASIWEVALPASMSGGASPTLREGGTIVVPVGNGLALLNGDGELLWHTAFPGAASEDITGAPLVDEDGTIFTVGYAFAYAVNPGGAVAWSIAVPNLQYVPAHVGMSPTNGRIYFGCSNHALFAVERSGLVAWTFVVADRDVDASVAISEDGVIFQSFGNFVHRVVDYGAFGDDTHSANGGSDLDAHVSVWRDAQGADHVLTNANSSSGLRSFSGATLAHEWTFPMTKHNSGNATPIIDKDGVIYVGDDQGRFYAVNPNGTERWRLSTEGNDVDSQAALVPGGVIFGDGAGWLYYVASP